MAVFSFDGIRLWVDVACCGGGGGLEGDAAAVAASVVVLGFGGGGIGREFVVGRCVI